jgi:metal-responsive CopG/Arc/MetJ family transcriptional regulator
MKKSPGRPPIYGIPMHTRTCLAVPQHLLAVVDEIAARRGVSRSRILRDALTQYVERRNAVT